MKLPTISIVDALSLLTEAVRKEVLVASPTSVRAAWVPSLPSQAFLDFDGDSYYLLGRQ